METKCFFKKIALGEQHISLRKNVISARVIGPECQCNKKCFSNVSDEDKITLLSIFNSIGDKCKQDTLLGGLMRISTISRRRSRNGSRPHKSCFVKYEIRVGTTVTIVCKKAFYSLHGIDKSRVDRIIKKNKR